MTSGTASAVDRQGGDGLVGFFSSVGAQLGEVVAPCLGRTMIHDDFPGIYNVQKEFRIRRW